MAGNARFHDKLHRTNHHTLSTAGFLDSATDPIASPAHPFQGDFVVNGVLSSSRGLDVLSANYGGDVYCENIYVRDTTYTDFISGAGSETIISDGALTGYGENTLTLDYGKAIYAKVNNNTIMYMNSSNVGIGTTAPRFKLHLAQSGGVAQTLSDIDGGGPTQGRALTLKSPTVSTIAYVGTESNHDLGFYTSNTERMRIDFSGNVGIGTQTLNERLTIDKNISFVGTSAHYIKSSWGTDNGFIVFGGTNTGLGASNIHKFYSLSGNGNWGLISSDQSFDLILPYTYPIRQITYGSDNVNRYLLVNGTEQNPTAVGDDATIGGMVGYGYSGENKFNTYGLGGNAAIHLRTAGTQSLSNNGGYIKFSTTPINIGTAGAIERMRITSEGKVGIGTTDPSGLTSPFSATGRSVHLYNNTNDDTSTNSNTIFIAESVNRNAYFQAAIGLSGIGGLSVNRSSDAKALGRILVNYDGTTVFQNGNDGYTERMRILSGGNVGIGTTTPTEKLHVDGNLLVTGNISALGDLTQIDTAIVTTSAMIIDTSGTTDALRITQRGTGNVILVEDETSDSTPFVVTSGGNVGIGTSSPYDVSGFTSLTINSPTSGGRVDFQRNGIQMGLIYTSTSANFDIEATGVSNRIRLNTNQQNRILINENGNVGIGTETPISKLHVNGSITIPNGNWLNLATNADGHTAIRRNTIQNGMEFFTTSASRMFISDGGNVGLGITNPTEKLHIDGNVLITGNLSALSTIYTLSGNSDNWNNTYSTVSSASANWESTYSTVSGTSANWQTSYSTVNSNSGKWESTYSTVSSNSAHWQNTYSTVSGTSANWESTYSTVNSNSGKWESTYSTVSGTSANWQTSYSTVSSNSANWESTYSTVSSNSGNWENTKTVVNSNSANWLSGSDTLSFQASSIKTDTLSANVLSANIIRVYQAIHVSVSAVTVAPATTTTMTINSPSYYFVTVSSAGTADFNLPSTIGNNNIGMLFYIKNVSPVNNQIVHVNNSAGTLLTNGTLNGGNGHHIEVVWDGTTWQQISLS